MEEMKNTITIQTVKEQVNKNNELIGYLLNGTMRVPGNAPGNKEYELIKQWLAEGNIPEPEFTEEELTARELNEKISTANQYLAQTDWVNAYKIRHDLGLELIPESSSKWEVINKRTEYIEFLKGVK